MIHKLFKAPNGKSYVFVFLLVTSLFILWGFCNGLIDVLNKHFQSSLQISKAASGLVQFANYIAYFLMAVPAGLLARRFGYKGGILIGLGLIALGAFWFIPAISIGTYWAFLLGLFVLAAGLATLETIANPYATVLGPAEGGALRINIAQSCNGIGWMLGPVVGGHFIFGSGAGAASSNAGLAVPYLGIGIIVAVLILIFAMAYVPDVHAEEEVKAEAEGKGTKPLVARKHFLFGVVAQFCYVAAQSGIFGFFINYVVENAHVVDKTASTWLGLYGFGLFLAGRLCGIGVLSVVKPQQALAVYGLINVALTLVAILGHGTLGLVGLFGTFFFMSLMFPTIFALGIHGLGDHTKLASSVIVMAIVGGALLPPIMGWIADVYSMRLGFVIPLVCFAIVALYGVLWRKLNDADSEDPVVAARGH